MRIDQKVEDGVTILSIQGRVVGDASLELRREINGWLAEMPEGQKPNMILNLAKVAMMDQSGLGVLVSSYTSVQKRDGRLVLVAPNKGVQNLIDITKLTRVFDIYKTVEKALASFEKSDVDEVFQENRDAYIAMKEELLKKHRGKFASFFKGKLVLVDSDKDELIRKTRERLGEVKALIYHITEQQIRLPQRRRIESTDFRS